MRADQCWAAMRALPVRDFAAGFGDAAVLVLAPHPDDESLGCGGMIAAACARGTPPVVAILTDGSRSHPGSVAYPAERLRDLREQEAAAAVAALGLPRDRLVFLRYPDTAAPVAGPALDAAARRLADLAQACGCRSIVVSWRHDPHCDHEAAAAIAAAACRLIGARLLSYPVWGWTLPPQTALDVARIDGFRLDMRDQLDRKRRAILAHASQHAGVITDDPGGFQLAPGFIDGFLSPYEIFLDTVP